MFYFNTNKPKIIFSLAKLVISKNYIKSKLYQNYINWLYQKAKGPLRGDGGCAPPDPSTTSIPEGGPLSSFKPTYPTTQNIIEPSEPPLTNRDS